MHSLDENREDPPTEGRRRPFKDFCDSGALLSEQDEVGDTKTYAYDLDGRTTTMTDSTGTSAWSYDLAGRTTGLTTPQGAQTYGYDPWGRRMTLDQGGGNVTTTTYANEKLASVVKAPENETTTWSYDAYGRITAQTLPNGAVTAYGYDALDRVNAITHRRADSAVISAESDVYDAAGNLTYKVVDGVRTDYAYDALDQLHGEEAETLYWVRQGWWYWHNKLKKKSGVRPNLGKPWFNPKWRM